MSSCLGTETGPVSPSSEGKAVSVAGECRQIVNQICWDPLPQTELGAAAPERMSTLDFRWPVVTSYNYMV